MKRSGIVAVIAAVSILALAGISCAEDLKIGAGGAPTENILKPVRAAFESATGIKLYIVSSGPKNAFLDLQKGELDAAGAGMTYQDLLAMMKKEGAEVKDPSAYNAIVVGKDYVKVIVHKDNKIQKLTAAQIQGIFSGEISSWKDVGGDDMPILVVMGKLTPGTNTMFSKKFLGGKAFAKEVLDATTADDVRQNVASNPAAIGFGPLSIVDGSIKAPEVPELSRDIIFLTKGKPSPKMQKLLDYIKGDGRKYIKQ